jgi:hypothetical protein
MGGAYNTHEEMRNACKILVRKHEEARPLRRLGNIWEDNIKRDIEETASDGVQWTEAALDRVQWGALLNTVMNLRVP